MGKIIETKLNRFDGGISEDIRENIANTFAFSKDMKIERHKMISHRDWDAWTNDSEKITRFLYAKDSSGVTYRLYGFGGDANNKPKIFNAALASVAWSTVATATTGARAKNVFFLYKDYVYFWQNLTVLSRMNLVGTPAITESYQAIAYVNVAQPVHHPADDIAYFFQDNIVHKLNNTTWTGSVLTLPDNLKIVGGAAYGNYLVIGCTSVKKDVANSVLFFWDRNSTITTISDKIDLGYGELIHISPSEDGGFYLVQNATRNSSLYSDSESIQIKYYNGSFITREIKLSSQDYFSGFLINYSAFESNAMEDKGALYFPALLTAAKDSETYHGIIKVWREGGMLRWTMDRAVAGIAANNYINGIYNIEGSWYLAHSNAYTISQGNDNDLEGVVETNQVSGKKRKLVGVTVFIDPEVNAFTLSYRKDNDTAWTEIFSKASGNNMEHSTTKGVNGASLPEYNKNQFQIKSTATAIIGLSYMEEFIEKASYG